MYHRFRVMDPETAEKGGGGGGEPRNMKLNAAFGSILFNFFFIKTEFYG